MPDTQYELVKGALASGVDAVERLERFAAGESTRDDLDHYGFPERLNPDEWVGLLEILDYAVLEVVNVTRQAWGHGDAEVEQVELLLGYGGPTIRATYHRHGNVEIHAAWGTDTGTATAYAPNTAFELFDVADMQEVGQ